MGNEKKIVRDCINFPQAYLASFRENPPKNGNILGMPMIAYMFCEASNVTRSVLINLWQMYPTHKVNVTEAPT